VIDQSNFRDADIFIHPRTGCCGTLRHAS